MAKALDLIDGIKPGAVLADRAYDADRLMDAILDAGAEPTKAPPQTFSDRSAPSSR